MKQGGKIHGRKSRVGSDTVQPESYDVRTEFCQVVADVLRNARSSSYRAVNFIMVEAYWKVGRMIAEEEQEGKERAEYGAFLIRNLSRHLSSELGKGFTEPNLRNFRQFYLCFPILDAVRDGSPEPSYPSTSEIRYALRSELRWTHYRSLMRLESSEAREWYMKEAADRAEIEREREMVVRERMESYGVGPVVKAGLDAYEAA